MDPVWFQYDPVGSPACWFDSSCRVCSKPSLESSANFSLNSKKVWRKVRKCTEMGRMFAKLCCAFYIILHHSTISHIPLIYWPNQVLLRGTGETKLLIVSHLQKCQLSIKMHTAYSMTMLSILSKISMYSVIPCHSISYHDLCTFRGLELPEVLLEAKTWRHEHDSNKSRTTSVAVCPVWSLEAADEGN